MRSLHETSKKFPSLDLRKGVLIVAIAKVLISFSVIVFVTSMAHYYEPLTASWSSTAIVSCSFFHIFVSILLIQARMTRQQKHILPFLVVDGLVMLWFLYLTGINFDTIFDESNSLFSRTAAVLAGVWILQIAAYLTVLAFWAIQYNSVANQKQAVISPIFTIFPLETCDYKKFVNKNDPAIKAAAKEKDCTSQTADNLLLILYFAVISVNCYLFAVMEGSSCNRMTVSVQLTFE